MKILQINCVYKYGSTGKIVYDLHSSYLATGLDSYVIYGRGKKIKDKNVYKCSSELEAKVHSIQSRLFGVDFGYSFFATNRCIRIIKKINPDVVHLHCLNGHFINAYKLIKYLKRNHIKTVLTLHAEIMHTSGCEHALDCNKWISGCYDCKKINGTISHYFRDDAKHCYGLMKKAIDNFNEVIVVGCSNWVIERAKKSAIFSTIKSFATVTNGIDTISFIFVDTNLKEKLGIKKGKKIILHVTPNFKSFIKGGNFLVEMAKMMPTYHFVIVGSKSDINIPNMLFVGRTNNKKELAEYYSMADCLAMTSYRETYPTVCLEASSCGLNIVGFNTGGVPETIPDNMGECVEAYNVEKFVEALKKWANREKSFNYHVKTPKEMAQEYLDIYRKK